jgi:hypothetical protein
MTTRTRTLLNRMYAHNALRQSHGLSRERLTLVELAALLGASLQQTRDSYTALNRRCHADSVLKHGIAQYALTEAGRARAKAPETKRDRSRRGAPYVPRGKHPVAKPATFEPLIPTELVKRVPRSIFDWIP